MLKSLTATLRYKTSGLPLPHPQCIYILWHRNIIPLLLRHAGEKAAVIISASRDGDLIAEPAKLLGYKTARGSSARDAIGALRSILKYSKDHTIAITPDGPKGPAKQIKDGALYIAYMAKLPVIPIALTINKEWVFHSWDKFRLPKPFSTIHIKYGEPYFIQTKEELASSTLIVQELMNNLESELIHHEELD